MKNKVTLYFGRFLLLLCIATFSSCSPKTAFEGSWQFAIPTPRGERNPILIVEGKKGTFDQVPIKIEIVKDTVSFSAASKAGKLGLMKLKYQGILKNGKIEGTYEVEDGPFAGRSSIFSAEKMNETKDSRDK